MKPARDWTRREFLGRVAAASAAISFPAVLRGADFKSAGRKPNVLFIMSDDMRVELGCYGGGTFGARTPHLDAFARRGVRFHYNYCQFPLCNPSRASMLTGRKPTTTRVLGNRTDFRTVHPEWVTLPQLYRENGYVSVRAGKMYHGGMDDEPSWTRVSDPGGRTAEGADLGRTMELAREHTAAPGDVLPPLPADRARSAQSDRIVVLDGNGEGHGDYLTAERTIENLRRHQDEPFFIACGFSKPHSPLAAPERFFDWYDPAKIRLPPDFAPWPTVPPGFPSAAIRKRNADLFIGRAASENEAREYIRAYLASMSWVDWNVGRVLGELERLGLRDKTIVVFVADHGFQLGEKGKWSKAGSLFEMGTRVPLIIAAPAMRGNGRSCLRIVESLDIYPTLVELCGLPRQKELEGKSVAPLLRNPAARWNKPAYSVWSEDGETLHGVAVRTERWRYAEFGPEGRDGAMLLDPRNDPLELKNLAGEKKYQSVCAELSALTRAYAAALAKT